MMRQYCASEPTFCRACGASIPHRIGEGRCPECIQHLTQIAFPDDDPVGNLRKLVDLGEMYVEDAIKRGYEPPDAPPPKGADHE